MWLWVCAGGECDDVSDIYYFLLPSSRSACTKRRWDFYSVKVEWLARRRWHMATKITTVTRLTTIRTNTPTTAARPIFLSWHDKCTTFLLLHNIFFSLPFMKFEANLNCTANQNRSSLPDFPFLASIVLSLFRDLRCTLRDFRKKRETFSSK